MVVNRKPFSLWREDSPNVSRWRNRLKQFTGGLSKGLRIKEYKLRRAMPKK